MSDNGCRKQWVVCAALACFFMAGCRHQRSPLKINTFSDSLFFLHHVPETERGHEIKRQRAVYIVSRIEVLVLKPAGMDILDTAKRSNTLPQRVINSSHILTKPSAVKLLLLFRENDTVSAFHFTESERLLRKYLKVRDARIIVAPVEKGSPLSRVTVLIQDQISINVGINNLNKLTTYTLADRNFLGYGSTVQGSAAFYNRKYSFYSVAFEDPSIYNSFLALSVNYSAADSNYTNGIRINKTFTSGLFKWAGGSGYILKNNNRLIYKDTTLIGRYNSDIIQVDTWAGRAFEVGGRNSRSHSMRHIVIAARHVNTFERISRVSLINDSVPQLINNTGDKLFVSGGFISRRYFKDSYIFRFRYSEDIPEGFLFSALAGKSFNRGYPDNYFLGLTAVIANTNRFGYWNLAGQRVMSFSTFGAFHHSVHSLRLFYLSPLLLKKTFKDRLLISAKFQKIGNDQVFDRLYLTNDDGFLNLNSRALTGLVKTAFNITNILYTPYKPLGFYIGFFTYAAFANLSPVKDIAVNRNWYQSYGVGVLLRNENLLINSIRIAFTWYPSFPEHAYKFNPLWIYELQIPDVAINQPEYELN